KEILSEIDAVVRTFLRLPQVDLVHEIEDLLGRRHRARLGRHGGRRRTLRGGGRRLLHLQDLQGEIVLGRGRSRGPARRNGRWARGRHRTGRPWGGRRRWLRPDRLRRDTVLRRAIELVLRGQVVENELGDCLERVLDTDPRGRDRLVERRVV